MDLEGQRIVIAGAGIGGLTVAAAMLQAGCHVTIAERRTELVRVQAGGGMHLWHNGIRALATLGLDVPVVELGERGAAVQTAEFCSYKRGVLATWPVAQIADDIGAPTVGVSRDQLHQILLDAAGAAELRLGAECQAIEESDGLRLRLADGTAIEADLIIGADGLNSMVRQHLIGEIPARPAGYSTWQAIVEYENSAAPPGLFRVIWGPGARFLYYRLADGRMYWEGQFAAKPGGTDPEGRRKAEVLRRFGAWGPPISGIVAATEEQAISRLDVQDRPPLRSWSRGQITLLGDAAHPMTNAIGQGANQTIEDAVVLARVAREQPDWRAALSEYERLRIPRTTSMVRTARNLQRFNRWRGPVTCRVRDQLIRIGFSTVALRQHTKDMAAAF
jgi:2-polyprenyl-6-methoxyphenol hydroxylase-like FAD-dependent oxidoreductase